MFFKWLLYLCKTNIGISAFSNAGKSFSLSPKYMVKSALKSFFKKINASPLFNLLIKISINGSFS